MGFPQRGGRFGGFSGPGMFGPGAGGGFGGMARPSMVPPGAGGFPGPMQGMQGPGMQMGAMHMMGPGPGPSGPMMGMAPLGGPLARPGMVGMQPGMQGALGCAVCACSLTIAIAYPLSCLTLARVSLVCTEH